MSSPRSADELLGAALAALVEVIAARVELDEADEKFARAFDVVASSTFVHLAASPRREVAS